MWIDVDGKRYYDFINDIALDNYEVGDIIEYIYRASIDWNYNQFVVYPSSIYPKLSCNIKVIARCPIAYSSVKTVFDYKIPKENVSVKVEHKKGEDLETHTYDFKGL